VLRARGGEPVKNILAQGEVEALDRFVTRGTLLAFEYDGALAPISKDPRAAQVRKRTLRLLAEVAQHYPTAVISGRTRAELLARLNGAPVRAVIGNHGLEPSPDAPSYHALVRQWLPVLRDSLDGQQGIELENKLYSLSIHYRHARAKSVARSLIEAAITKLGNTAAANDGKQVVNIVPANAPDKGSALLALRRSMSADNAVFVGDEVTAENVFRGDDASRVLGIRIGRSASSGASHYVAKQSDIDRLLQHLLELQQQPVEAPARKKRSAA
jgi:trehalose 6-phosphate phosphatase